jgi:hypothetical protein
MQFQTRRPAENRQSRVTRNKLAREQVRISTRIDSSERATASGQGFEQADRDGPFEDAMPRTGKGFMARRFLIGREISWGGQIPSGWDLAWYEPRRRVAVYFPSPLHRLARVVRDLQWRLHLAWSALPQERHENCELQRLCRERRILAEEYARGYLEGWQECFDAWARAMNCDSDECKGREN